MKKILFILLLCFTVAFAAFAIDMSPHPGDTLETVFTVEDNVVISQAVSAPTDVLYFEQFNIYNGTKLCMTANDEIIETPNYLMGSGYNVVTAVSDTGYEVGKEIYKISEDIAIYCMEYG